MGDTNNLEIIKIKNLRKLCILNVEETETDENIRSLCAEYGNLINFNRISHKHLAFALYETQM